MKYIFYLLVIIGFAHFGLGQNLAGFWRGAMIQNGYAMEKSVPFMLEISIQGATVTGFSRDEIYNTESYALKKLSGIAEQNKLTFKQTVISKKTTSSKLNWCKMDAELTYNEKTGYLEGTYKSSDCRNISGKMILYRMDGKISMDAKPSETHHWFDQLVKDVAKGLNAPEIRKKERESFVFKPIYFDYDKDEIKPEFFTFLNDMIKIIEGHTDLRVKVTGHTDADGSDAYNDGLSARRAKAIIDFFVARGLSRDRLEFEFKGEKAPVDSNETSEGKQRNRRVDFKFI